MLNYYFTLAWRSIHNQRGLSFLISSTLGLGIAACTITFALIYLMSSDPVPGKSDRIFRVQMDNWSPNAAAIAPDLPPEEVSWRDANNIVDAHKAKYQSASAITWGMVTPQEDNITPFLGLIRVTNGEFFPMFRLPFLYGEAWDNYAANEAEYVVVLSKETNDKLFQGENSIGRTVPMLGSLFTVVGVLDEWHPTPKFYDLSYGAFYKVEDMYIPLGLKPTLELPHGGVYNCWETDLDDGYQTFFSSECTNFQLWVELEDNQDITEYSQYIDTYVQQQKALGRFPRPMNNQLFDLPQWLQYKNVVGNDIYLFFWLSFLFLLVCLFNAASLLSTSFINKTKEVAVRRALGASQENMLSQFFIETLILGVMGGIVGLLLSVVGLEGIKLLYPRYAPLIHLDVTLISFTFFLSLVSSAIAGTIPMFKVCNLPPAQQLK